MSITGKTTQRRLARRADAIEKSSLGLFLSLRELALATGFSAPSICKLAKEPGFPIYEKHVTAKDFKAWLVKRSKKKFQAGASQRAKSANLQHADPRPGEALPFTVAGLRRR